MPTMRASLSFNPTKVRLKDTRLYTQQPLYGGFNPTKVRLKVDEIELRYVAADELQPYKGSSESRHDPGDGQ